MVKTFTFTTFLLSVSCIWGLTLDVKACLGSEETNDTVPIRDTEYVFQQKYKDSKHKFHICYRKEGVTA